MDYLECIFCVFECFDDLHDPEACAPGTPEASGEYYDLEADPYQLTNAIASLSPDDLAAKRARLEALWTCEGGAACAGL